MEEKLNRLKSILEDLGSVLVAYSGGVDSTFLASVAHEVLGDRALAVVAASATYPQDEVDSAKELAAQIGIRCLEIHTNELENPLFVANSADRCYYCKGELFGDLDKIAKQEGFAYVLDGTNFDDLGDFRPGRRAAEELGVRSPLCEAELTKAEIRKFSFQRGLPTWDKPAMACFSSRVPYGTSITTEILEKIAKAERYLHKLGLGQLRVRHHDRIARIEVEPAQIAKLVEPEVRQGIVDHFKSLGYTYVTLDLSGYRTGSMNEVLAKQNAS